MKRLRFPDLIVPDELEADVGDVLHVEVVVQVAGVYPHHVTGFPTNSKVEKRDLRGVHRAFRRRVRKAVGW